MCKSVGLILLVKMRRNIKLKKLSKTSKTVTVKPLPVWFDTTCLRGLKGALLLSLVHFNLGQTSRRLRERTQDEKENEFRLCSYRFGML